jgi:anti-sigma regulatory factor (Ser/Thr protein kinase)
VVARAYLNRTSRPRVESAEAGVAHLALVLIAAAVSTLVIRSMLAPEFALSDAGTAGLMVAWVLPLVLASNVVATVLHDRDAVRTQLVVMLGPEWYAQLMRTHVDGAAARDIADRLHGDLQGELLAAAARIERLSRDDVAIRAELALVGERLERAMSVGTGVAPQPLHVRLADLQARWSGLLDVRVELDLAGLIGARSEDLIVGIVSEALTNARRHGMAQEVDVRVIGLREDGSGVRVQVDDDGVGPRKGGAGIGSAHLDAVAPGAWSRVRREAGGTRLEVVLADPMAGLRAGEHGSATSHFGAASRAVGSGAPVARLIPEARACRACRRVSVEAA